MIYRITKIHDDGIEESRSFSTDKYRIWDSIDDPHDATGSFGITLRPWAAIEDEARRHEEYERWAESPEGQRRLHEERRLNTPG